MDASQSECRNYNSEYFRLKAAHDDVIEQLDVVKRENKNLADEIRDLLEQLGDGGRSIHELDKNRRRLEVEKEELQAALEEAEAALEQEENKVLRVQLELGQVRQEIDRKIQEKEEEFENTRLDLLFRTNIYSTTLKRCSSIETFIVSLKLSLILQEESSKSNGFSWCITRRGTESKGRCSSHQEEIGVRHK